MLPSARAAIDPMSDESTLAWRGWGDVSSLLRDFAITTWDVDPGALARLLPPELSPDVFALDDGRSRAFVSAVTFLNTRFFVRFAPFVRLDAYQTNYRAYVLRGDQRVVWFFGTSLASIGVIVPRWIWGLPWARSTITAEAEWRGGELDRYRWEGRSALGVEQLRLRGTGRPLERLDGFADAEQTRLVLTHPMVGYLRRRKTTVVTYAVSHAPLEMELATVEHARFGLFEALGLVAAERAPHSVLVQRSTQYRIHLPPRRAREFAPALRSNAPAGAGSPASSRGIAADPLRR